jgi:N-acetylglucosaminyldiphosphoundecaprenol N-acetyl-beta-D-mannosaminyltransferase
MTTAPMVSPLSGSGALRPSARWSRRQAAVNQARLGGVRDRIPLNGVLIDRVRLADAASRLETYLTMPQLHQVVAVNLDCLRIAEADAVFRETINEADLAVADGMPLVWASRLAARGLPERVTGNELVDVCCRLSAATGAALFFLGGRPGVAEESARTVERRYPGARVAGTYSPPFGTLSPQDDAEIVDRINRSGARILIVALGAPRQDNWIRAHRNELQAVRIALGVGCGLDILAGLVARAPCWMQRMGLEWLHRFRLEPTRLWHRYFVDDTPTFARLVAESLRVSRS